MAVTIEQLDFENAAAKLNCEVAAIKAVYDVESAGGGFLSDNDTPKILFEGHVFWRQLKDKQVNPEQYVSGNENVLYKSWTRKYYKGGFGEYDRLKKAIEIVPKSHPLRNVFEECAVRSCSWGAFQIMAFHAEKLGYQDAIDFMYTIAGNEKMQLQIFIDFVTAFDLVKYLRSKNWAAFARGFNGPAYAVNRYDQKMAAAYNKFSK